MVVLAQEEARTLKHDHIGTEHMLLGLVGAKEGFAAHVLENLDITIERVRAQVVRVAPLGEQVTSGAIPFTPGAKKVLELALREALSLGHNFIATEHILLGVISESESLAARILLDFDADSETIRDEVIRMLSGPGRPQDTGTIRAQHREDDPAHARCTSSADVHDLDEMSDSELDNLLAALLYEERAITSRRRMIQGKIDILRVERAKRRTRRRESGR